VNTLSLGCWVCNSRKIELERHGRRVDELRPELFRITAADYGVTGDQYRCRDCGFLFCPTVGRVLEQYERMTDPAYEETRRQRGLQAKELLNVIGRYKRNGEFLDVGAGTGILVEQALKLSYAAVGIEPSLSLSHIAQQRELPVVTGTLPQRHFLARFDVVTLIDVIEHVDSPLSLVLDAAAAMKHGAICVIVTPDVSSIAARLMRAKWWHYRLAHISYFERRTLEKLLNRAGLEIVATHRPGWYFPLSYLVQRVMQYLPASLRVGVPAALDRITIPLNLFDSLLVVAKSR
jgi:2-polyprenyl-3-methyl-5-hydroxy-6-metoxy-1,4-benzoquinol methylase